MARPNYQFKKRQKELAKKKKKEEKRKRKLEIKAVEIDETEKAPTLSMEDHYMPMLVGFPNSILQSMGVRPTQFTENRKYGCQAYTVHREPQEQISKIVSDLDLSNVYGLTPMPFIIINELTWPPKQFGLRESSLR